MTQRFADRLCCLRRPCRCSPLCNLARLDRLVEKRGTALIQASNIAWADIMEMMLRGNIWRDRRRRRTRLYFQGRRARGGGIRAPETEFHFGQSGFKGRYIFFPFEMSLLEMTTKAEKAQKKCKILLLTVVQLCLLWAGSRGRGRFVGMQYQMLDSFHRGGFYRSGSVQVNNPISTLH